MPYGGGSGIVVSTDRNHTSPDLIKTMSTVTACVVYFLPTDARHWIPNGTAFTTVEVDSDTAEYGDVSDWYDEVEFAAEKWCESVHGKGSFFQVVWED